MVKKVKITTQKKGPHIGSSLDRFLKEEGIFEEVKTQVMREGLELETEENNALPRLEKLLLTPSVLE